MPRTKQKTATKMIEILTVALNANGEEDFVITEHDLNGRKPEDLDDDFFEEEVESLLEQDGYSQPMLHFLDQPQWAGLWSFARHYLGQQ